MKYELTSLPFAQTALEPWIDATTVSIHHDEHQATYVNNLNAALAKFPDFEFSGHLHNLLGNLDLVPQEIRTAVRNNGGGVFNHEFYWGGLSGEHTVASKKFSDALEKSFGSTENFRREMTAKTAAVFGSGYGWLCVDNLGGLKIMTTPNQDNQFSAPCACGVDFKPIFCIDVWEHAYYLKYQNMRVEYLNGIWEVVNWEKLSQRYECLLSDSKLLI